MTFTTKYQRPVSAKLVVQLENGEQWDATAEDLQNFNLFNGNDAFREHLRLLEGRLGQLAEAANLDSDDIANTDAYGALLTMVHSGAYPDRGEDSRAKLVRAISFFLEFAVQEAKEAD